jgi:hypothetical protein
MPFRPILYYCKDPACRGKAGFKNIAGLSSHKTRIHGSVVPSPEEQRQARRTAPPPPINASDDDAADAMDEDAPFIHPDLDIDRNSDMDVDRPEPPSGLDEGRSNNRAGPEPPADGVAAQWTALKDDKGRYTGRVRSHPQMSGTFIVLSLIAAP